MKVRYKITAAFVLLTGILLAAICGMIYFITADQQKNDFYQRLHNRALTVTALLSRLPANGYQMLSKLDSSTTSLLVAENIQVYDQAGQVLYRFSRMGEENVTYDQKILQEAHEKGYARVTVNDRRIVAVYFHQSTTPILVVTSAFDENGRKNLHKLLQSLLIAFFTGTALSFLTGWLFSRQLLIPVEKIASTVSIITANNIERRLAEPVIDDEWKKLAVTFNNLLKRLQDSFEIQGRFISNASHELSTPLTAVSNQIDVILQKDRTKAEYLSVLQSVQADVEQMSALTQQLLNLARTARGGSLQTEPVRVDEILMEIPSLLKKISTDYNALVFFDELPEDESLSTVNGNYELLLSAFRNIAENGCKYAPDHTVNISLSFVGNRIVVLFNNHYTFFNDDDLQTMFQPFQRGSNAGKAPGHGLGLSLTRRIILLHKGEIKAEMLDQNKLLISVILPSSF